MPYTTCKNASGPTLHISFFLSSSPCTAPPPPPRARPSREHPQSECSSALVSTLVYTHNTHLTHDLISTCTNPKRPRLHRTSSAIEFAVCFCDLAGYPAPSECVKFVRPRQCLAGRRARSTLRAGGGGQVGQGRRLRRAARRVPARAGRTAAERRSKRPARRGSTRVKGGGGGRAVAGGLHPGRGGGEGALVERCSHRSTETRREADEEGGVAPGGAGAGASRHREAAGRRARAREAPPERRAHSSPLRLRGNCARRAGLTRAGEDLRRAPEPRQHAPPFPAAPASRLGPLARRRAEAPESCTVPPTDQVS